MPDTFVAIDRTQTVVDKPVLASTHLQAAINMDVTHLQAIVSYGFCSAFVTPFGDGHDGAGPTATGDLAVPAEGLEFTDWIIPTGVTITLTAGAGNVGIYKIAVSGTFEMQGTASIVCTGKGAAGGAGGTQVSGSNHGKGGAKGSPSLDKNPAHGGGGGGAGGGASSTYTGGLGNHGGNYLTNGPAADSTGTQDVTDLIGFVPGAGSNRTAAAGAGASGTAGGAALAPSSRANPPSYGAGGGGGGSGASFSVGPGGTAGAGGAGGAGLRIEARTGILSATCSIINSGAAGAQGGQGADVNQGCGGSGGGGEGGQTLVLVDNLTNAGATLTNNGGAGGAAQTGTGNNGGAGGNGGAGWSQIVEV